MLFLVQKGMGEVCAAMKYGSNKLNAAVLKFLQWYTQLLFFTINHEYFIVKIVSDGLAYAKIKCSKRYSLLW